MPPTAKKRARFGPLIAESAAYLKGHKAAMRIAAITSGSSTRQGKNAPGGAYSYVINGRMIAGFAMVAYPADVWRQRRDDVHRQQQRQDLREGSGQELEQIGAAMTTFDPGPGWNLVAPPAAN